MDQQVLQRADHRVGRQVITRRAREMPVLHEQQRRTGLLGDAEPLRIRQEHHRRDGRPQQHEHQRGEQSPAPPRRNTGRGSSGACDSATRSQGADEEEAREREKDVDTTGHPSEPDVEDHDEGDRKTPHAVEIGAIPETGRRCRSDLGTDPRYGLAYMCSSVSWARRCLGR